MISTHMPSLPSPKENTMPLVFVLIAFGIQRF
jgi:hypothetical protein